MRYAFIAGLAFLSACGGGSPKTKSAAAPMPPTDMTAAIPQAAGIPDVYKVRLITTKGDIVVEVRKEWAPLGAQRFYDLVKTNYYDNAPWFRVIGGFMAQTGINGDPKITAAWRNQRIKDDPVKQSNTPGMVTFAMGGPNTRSSHIFINTGQNGQLDGMGFAPFGKVVAGMNVVTALYPIGDSTVDQGRANFEGEAYFKTFRNLDRIKDAVLE